MKCLLLVLSLSGLASAIFVNNAATRCPLTVAQAEAACSALGRRSNHFTSHPTECAAFVQCDGVEQATVTAVPEGTMWDEATGAAVHLQASNCQFSPCRTNRPISDCSTCYGYLKCVNNQVVSDRCPQGYSFSRTAFQCVPDSTCRLPVYQPENLISCVPIPSSNLFRKTAQLGASTYTADIPCPASTVMNVTSCQCVPSDVTACPIILGDIQNLELRGGVTPYTIQGMDTNQLTGDFTFTLTGVSLSSNAAVGTVALASNSRSGAPGCETPTFELTLDSSSSSVTFMAVSVDNKRATLRATGLSTTSIGEIRVERRGSTLSLYINGSPRDQSILLESARLASTLCSLDIGNSFNRNNFQGQISRVRLQREC